ncbi:shugoshin Sgo2 [Schizosaccharomyces cryophilus OY26]|uniref:Shugoshin Sgo2 n=1 Tax=Schizosaccharomyces cryophilus (strain OY26 / ATCC MYA-4695 / CBS 11777 / NBRC 106824 / NRRL Y48691) TaxID=653667 RepID=S9X7E7_SCHCR|nr:shugoshin Sgo2 [Schizosaccharomyces cryophilus OY26]EPY53012.1 shugoshin Sgo2 [Schizosaccharomyces cryophilus OY26]
MSTASPSLTLEESKKKQLRQYKEIIRISKAQSARIKELQLENERLLSENIDLRSVAINLEEQLESQQIKNERLQEGLNSILSECQGGAESFLKSLSQYRQDAQDLFRTSESQMSREYETDQEDLDEETFVKETEDILKEANEDATIKNLSCLLNGDGHQSEPSTNAPKKSLSSLTDKHQGNEKQENSEEKTRSHPSEIIRSSNESREENNVSSNVKYSAEITPDAPESFETNGSNVRNELHNQPPVLNSKSSDNFNVLNSNTVPVNNERHLSASSSRNTANEASVETQLPQNSKSKSSQEVGVSNDSYHTGHENPNIPLSNPFSLTIEPQQLPSKEPDTASGYPADSEIMQNPGTLAFQPIPTSGQNPGTIDMNVQESHRLSTHLDSHILPEKRKNSLSRISAASDTSDSDEPLSALRVPNDRYSSEPPRHGEVGNSRNDSTASNPLWLQGILNNRAPPDRGSTKETLNLTQNEESAYNNLQLLSTVTNLRFFETHAADDNIIEKEKKEEPPVKKSKRGRPPGSTNKTVSPDSPEQPSRSASEELNDGRSRREKKRVNYALPGLRTKMRRDFNLPTDHAKPRKQRRARTAEPVAENSDS